MSRLLSPTAPTTPAQSMDAAAGQTKRLKSKSSFSFSRRKSPSTSSKAKEPLPASPPAVQVVLASSPVVAKEEFAKTSIDSPSRFEQSPRLPDHTPPRHSPVVQQVQSLRTHAVSELPVQYYDQDERAGNRGTVVLDHEGDEDEMGDEMGSGYVRDGAQEDSEEEKRRKRFSLRDFQLPAHQLDSSLSEFGLFDGDFGMMGENGFDQNAAFIDKPTMPLRLKTILPESLHSVSSVSVSTQSDDNPDPSTSPSRSTDAPRPRDRNLLDFPTPPSTHLPPVPPVVLPRRTSSLTPSSHNARSATSSPRASTTPVMQQYSPSTSTRSTPKIKQEEREARKSPAQDLEASLRALEIAEIGLGLSASESTNSLVSTTSSMREELFFNYRAMSAHLKAQEAASSHSPSQSQPMSPTSSQSSSRPDQFTTERHLLSSSINSESPSLASTVESVGSGVRPRTSSSSPTNYRSNSIAGPTSPYFQTTALDSPVALINTSPFVRPTAALDVDRISLNVSPKSGPRVLPPSSVEPPPASSPVLQREVAGPPIWAESFPPTPTPTRTTFPSFSKRATPPPSRTPPSPTLPPLPVQSTSNPTTPTLPRKKSFSLLRRRKSEVELGAVLVKGVEPPLPDDARRRSSEGGSVDGSGGSGGKRKSKFSMFLPKRKDKGEVPPLPSNSSRTTSPYASSSPRFPSHSASPSTISRGTTDSAPATPTQASFNSASPGESRLIPPSRKESLSSGVISSGGPLEVDAGSVGQSVKSNGSPQVIEERNARTTESVSSDLPPASEVETSNHALPSPVTTQLPYLSSDAAVLPPPIEQSPPQPTTDSPPLVESLPSSPPVVTDDSSAGPHSVEPTSDIAPPTEDFESMSQEAFRAMESRHIPSPPSRQESVVDDTATEELFAQEEEEKKYSRLPKSVSDALAISGQYENAIEADDDRPVLEEITEGKEEEPFIVGAAREGDTTLDDETDSEEDDVPLGTLPGALRMQKSLRLKNSSRSTSRNQANASKKSSLSTNSIVVPTVNPVVAPKRNPFEFDPTVTSDSGPTENKERGSANGVLDVAQSHVGHSMLPQTDESVVRRQGVVKSPSLPLDQVISDSVLTLDHPPPPPLVAVPLAPSTARPPAVQQPQLIRQKSPPAPIDTAASNYARSHTEPAPTLAATYGLNRQPSGSSASQRPALLTRNSHDSHSYPHSTRESSRSRAGTINSTGAPSLPSSRRPSSANKDSPTSDSISPHSHSAPPQPCPNTSAPPPASPLPTQPILSKHRVYVVDHTRSIVISATALTRCGDIVAEARAQGSLAAKSGDEDEAGGYALWEIWRTLGVERPTREFELLTDVIKSWSHESPNIFIIRKTSMLPVLASHLRLRPLMPRAGWATIEVKRGKWVKRWLELKETTLTHYKSEKLKEPIQLCQLASFDAFFVAPHTATTIKAPKAFSFAIKSVLPSAHYENGDEFCHFVCVKLEDERDAWVKAIISARNGVVRQRERDMMASLATATQGLTSPTTQQSTSNTTTTQSYRQPAQSNGLVNPAAAARSKSVSHRPPPTLLQQHPQLSTPMVPALSLDSRLHPPTNSGVPMTNGAIGASSRPNAAAWAGMSLHDRQQWLKGAQADARENGHTFLQF